MYIRRFSFIFYWICCQALGTDALRQKEVVFKTSRQVEDLGKYTPLSFYGYEAENDKMEFCFSVKACSDAHISLKEDNTATSMHEHYDIILGELNNTKSAIRLAKRKRKEVEEFTEGLLNCREFRDFVISWKEHVIKVFWIKDKKRTEFMTYPDPKHLTIRYIEVATDSVEDGEWKFELSELLELSREQDVSIRTIKQSGNSSSYTYTPLYFFGYEIKNYEREFNFSVKTCNDAHVSLLESGSNVTVEVVLGGWNNTKSVIRSGQEKAAVVYVEKKKDHVVNCHHYKDFTISWAKDIHVYAVDENTRTKLMTYTPPKPLKVKEIEITTGYFSEGYWRIKVPACYFSSRGEDYTGSEHRTSSGKECQKWSSNHPHNHTHHSEPENFCRNPDSRLKPWCYTTDKNTRFEYCDVHKCPPCGIFEEVDACTATITLQGMCMFSYQLNNKCFITLSSKENDAKGPITDVLLNGVMFQLRDEDEHRHEGCAILRQDMFKLTITYPVCEHNAAFKEPGTQHTDK